MMSVIPEKNILYLLSDSAAGWSETAVPWLCNEIPYYCGISPSIKKCYRICTPDVFRFMQHQPLEKKSPLKTAISTETTVA